MESRQPQPLNPFRNRLLEIEGSGSNNAIAFGNGSSGIYSKIFSSSTNKLNIEASSGLFLNSAGGNVGIGTTSPGTTLDVRGTNSGLQTSLSGVAHIGAGMAKLQFGYDSSVASGYAWIGATKNLNTWSDIAINPNGQGKLSVGTTTAATTLDVRGSAGALVSAANGIAFIGSGLAKLQIGYDTSTTNGYAWLASTKDSSTWSDLVFNPAGIGRVGVATTTPWKTLSVTGTVGFDGLTGSTGAGSLCLDSNKQVVYNSGSDACLSSLRSTKHGINPLAVDALSQVVALQPVSFVYNGDASSTARYGFIAEDTEAIDRSLATHDAQGKVSGIDDRSILSVLVKAVQEILLKIAGYADNFISAHITATLGDFDTANIKNANIQKANVQELCIGSACVTETEFKALLDRDGISPTPPLSEASTPTTPSDDTASTTHAINTPSLVPKYDVASTTLFAPDGDAASLGAIQ